MDLQDLLKKINENKEQSKDEEKIVIINIFLGGDE